MDNIAQDEDKIYAKSICIQVKDLRTANFEDAFQTFFSMIAELLSSVGQALTVENGNDYVF